ncbi:MAG: ABC transporter permease subunit [Alphaproteobacteria bacterium]|nr:ABC transporter permease subunit [Alphaproteobacteria bacterium]
MRARQLAALGVSIAALELVCRAGWVRPTTLIAPTAMVEAMLRALADPATLVDFGLTLAEVAAATLLATALGIALGLVLHALPRLRRAFEPFIASYYALPLFALYPVLVVVFGVGARPIVATGVLYATMSVVIGTLAGLDHIPPVLRKTARVQRLGMADTVFRVLMPACAPEILNGVALGLSYAFVAVIASEFLLASQGVGHAIADAYNSFKTPRMYGLVLALTLLVVLLNSGLRRIRGRLSVGEI